MHKLAINLYKILLRAAAFKASSVAIRKPAYSTFSFITKWYMSTSYHILIT